ncbi:CmpA/NrtA family ABC transporter substrate-binding protein [Marinospirillum sp.]|uniref:CmpA/NrtA family ABC transporter substrate-binding protein n=1 Tax=Marinospirillum sp. TaxID=2183934 RepID=UPI00286FD767|nr:CmpA/NrtA family ABC transporter substrate-binding protein [Marinospirillum sp.]MDR9468033.1 CmpA/NrtA family ABC transporter substrate-binding protein [Marinospirillum sp.]
MRKTIQPLNLTARRLAQATLLSSALVTGQVLALGAPEKQDLTFGFIKLTDMAPLAIAYEKGFFEDEGLYVQLKAQANWRVLLDGVIDGRLDGAHMLAGQPLGATVGFGTEAHIVTAYTMDLNGNAITLSQDVWEMMRPDLPKDDEGKPVHPISAEHLQPVIEEYNFMGENFNLGMVFPVSTHNYELRYWLAAGGIHPGYYAPQRGDTSGTQDAEVQISVTPPPQMPSTLEAGTIHGYSVGEPWNQQAVFRDIGVPVITDYDIRNNIAEKVFGVNNDWAESYPNTHLRVVRALIRAGHWLDENDNANRKEAAEIISNSYYVGADYEVIANSMTGVFEFEKGDVRPAPDYNVFFRYNATYPYYSDAIWYLTQMRRWGQLPEAKSDDWYMQTAQKVFLPEVYQEAAESLIADGLLKAEDFPDFAQEDGMRSIDHTTFIDGEKFDARQPNQYLQQFPIGLKNDETP